MVRKMSSSTNQKRPSFFKIIIAGYTTDHLMLISSKFLKHMRHDISETATLKLKTSSDCSWHVRVRRTTSGVYFKNGWQEFLDDNCLGNSELLVFTYDGHMRFSIQIFDKSGFERSDDFPNNSSTHENLNSCNRKKPRGKPQKLKQENIGSSEPFEIKEEEEEEDSQDSTAKDLKTFKSKIPHIIQTKSKIGVMALPTSFSKKYLSPGKSEMYKLENSNGRTSEVRVYPHASGRPILFPGNTSKPPGSSNTCKDKPVEILSCEDNNSKEEEEEYEHDTDVHLRAAEPEPLKPKFLHFTATIRSRHYLPIPTAFSREHFPPHERHEVTLMNAEGKEWVVKASPSHASHLFAGGWSKFVCDNRFNINDICQFELVKGNKIVACNLGAAARLKLLKAC